jgi:arginase family enzyme
MYDPVRNNFKKILGKDLLIYDNINKIYNKNIINDIKTKYIYISIDLDVLNNKVVSEEYKGGLLNIDNLLLLLRNLFNHFHIIGIDIGGFEINNDLGNNDLVNIIISIWRLFEYE